ncbi:hypothetical protein ACM66B_002024 [Microbotryomycetes sp. NB124-2]
MKALTVDDVQALSSLYDVHKDIVKRADRYGPFMRQAHLQAYVVRRYNSYYVPNMFNIVLWACVGFFVLAALALRLARVTPRSRARAKLQRVKTAILKHLWLSSAFGHQASNPLIFFNNRWLSLHLPLRIHSLLVFAYVAANMIVTFAFYTSYRPNIFWPDLGYGFAQQLRYFADRTGILAFGATPLVILLAGRNSPIGLLTGASYSTLQIYHRWIARTVYFHAVAHGIAFSLVEWLSSTPMENSYLEEWHEAYWRWGVAALCGGGLLSFASMRRIRELAYEFFLVGHIVGAVVWVVGCFYHVWLLRSDWYLLKFIYASVALWAFDRLARLVRMSYLNLGFTRQARKAQSAEAVVIPGQAYTRIRVTMARPWPKNCDRPGSYVFLSSPSVKAWQSHPFSIAVPCGMPSSTNGSFESDCSTPSSSSETKDMYIGDDTPSSELSNTKSTFEIVVKTHSGFTRQLVKHLERESSGDVESGEKAVGDVEMYKPLRVWVDGPYGPTSDLSSFDRVVLFAGGSGITVSIAHLASMAKQAQAGLLRTGKIDLVWAIPNAEPLCLLESVLVRIVPMLPAGSLSVHIHVTASDLSDKLAQDVSAQFPIISSLSSSFKHVRPVVSAYLDNTLASSGEHSTLAVSACGPPTLLDDARLAVKQRLDGVTWTSDRLVYHDELFTW